MKHLNLWALAILLIGLPVCGAMAQSGTDRVELELMTWPELKRAIHEQGKTTALVFNGGTEQRGPQGVTGAHTLVGKILVREIAEKLGNAIAAPVLPYSVNTADPDLPGTIGVSGALFASINEEVALQLIANGFKNVVLMGDHGGGQEELASVAKRLDARYAPQGIRVVYCGDNYAKAGADFNKWLEDHGYPVGAHASIKDTSEMLYLGGDKWVRRELIATAVGEPVRKRGQPADPGQKRIKNGIVGDARRSSPEIGKVISDMKVAYAVAQIHKLLDAAPSAAKYPDAYQQKTSGRKEPVMPFATNASPRTLPENPDTSIRTESLLSHLVCSETDEVYDADTLQNLSRTGKPLLARYALSAGRFTPADAARGPSSLWRYAPVLPVRLTASIRDLGEGFTPLLPGSVARRTLDMPQLYVKDESTNPTGSFKARGMAVAVARAFELGAREIAVGTAGNAGSALAAYAAAFGIRAHVAMPDDSPKAFIAECQAFGADLALVPGLITDANAHVQKGIRDHGWFDIATLREPYRIEGKKTMGYELVEQLGGRVPDVILYPTGGGTGLIGMWKAFDEMEQLGWIDSRRPRMISVQAAGCAPIVRAFERGERHAEPWQNAATSASGLRVPRAIGDFLILDGIRTSGGLAIAITDGEMRTAWAALATRSGIMVAPEGAATYAALEKLLEAGKIDRDEKVVLFNTGSGLKYLEAWF